MYIIKLIILIFTFQVFFPKTLISQYGENAYELIWSSSKIDFPNGIPVACWDCKTLPDFNENGRDEIFIAADDNIRGAWYFIVEADANDNYQVIWYYHIQDCIYSYVLNYTTEETDIDGDGLPEIIAGVSQDPGTGLSGLWIWEKDPSISNTYPFSMEVPTCTFDINGNSGAVTCVFTAQLDNDPNMEIVIGETNEDIIWVIEETGGDLSSPTFKVEYTDTLKYSPWGYFHGDIDNDGLPDFGIGTSDFNSLRIYENDGVPDNYIKHFEIHLEDDVDGYCLRNMGARDINEDGLDEIIYVRYTAPGKVFVVTNPGEIALIDSTNIHEIFIEPDSSRLAGFVYGNINHGVGSDGPNIYLGSRDSHNLFDLEYVGPRGVGTVSEAPGSKKNWGTNLIYTNVAQQRIQQMCIGDFNRNGKGEIAIIYAGSSDESYLEIIEYKFLNNDIKAPDAPINLLANGSNPSPWKSSDNFFSITWENPLDISGIARCFYKLSIQPVNDYDTTNTTMATPPIEINATEEYGQILYVWLEDSAGNIDYRQRDSILLRYDKTLPYIAELHPAKDANNIPVNTNINVHIRDNGSGLKKPSVTLSVNGSLVSPTIYGEASNYSVSYNPSANFNHNQHISVSLTAEDSAGNKMTESWSFKTAGIENNAPKAPTLVTPADLFFTNDATPELSWAVPKDANNDSLHFKVEIAFSTDFSSQITGSPFESHQNSSGFNPTLPVVSDSGSCSFTVTSNLAEGHYWWRVAAWDGTTYGSFSAEQKFSIDLTAPNIANPFPAKDTSGVAVSTDILVQIQDALSGVEQASIKMQVNGQMVNPTISGSATDFSLIYVPPTDFGYQKTVTVTLEAADQAGNQMTASYSFTTMQPPGGLSIAHDPQTSINYIENLPILTEITTTGTISSAKLYFRQGGATAYDSTNLTFFRNDIYQATIPAVTITERGIEYYFQATNNLGYSIQYPGYNPQQQPYAIRVQVDNLTCPNSTEARIYQMISIPLELADGRPAVVFSNEFSDYDKNIWRFFCYKDASYVEYTGVIDNFIPGRSFWLITQNPLQFDVGSGLSVPSDSNFVLQLQPGWNMLGNPFAFAVSWDSVTYDGTLQAPVAYDNGNYAYNQTVLQPWQGYLVYNFASSTTQIKVPPVETTSQLSKSKLPVAGRSTELQPGEWLLKISAQTENGILQDNENYLGCLQDANIHWDQHDLREVPAFTEYVRLYFPHSDWMKYPGQYTGDFRAKTEKGIAWDFTVETNLTDTPIKLSLSEQLNLADDWQIILVDQAAQLSIDFKTAREYSFSDQQRNFQILVGKSEYLEQPTLETQPIVQNFTLFQNYPNPFNPDTRISYYLPQSSQVVLTVYNLTGHKIQTLVKIFQPVGLHAAFWDGKLNSGETAPSGIYWYRLQAGEFVQVRKMILTK